MNNIDFNCQLDKFYCAIITLTLKPYSSHAHQLN
uniref:Uncharacterized protein n=1 Tax=Schistosoma haematobium TaxID=6185 RepID=A0A094ZGQ7_SCHHA